MFLPLGFSTYPTNYNPREHCFPSTTTRKQSNPGAFESRVLIYWVYKVSSPDLPDSESRALTASLSCF